MSFVTKCCCCFNLRYGCFAYGVICLIIRFCSITALYYTIPTLIVKSVRVGGVEGFFESGTLSSMGFSIGWCIATSFTLFIALKGIMQERSILLYPYIVVLIFEIVIMFLVNTIGAITSSLWYLLYLTIIGGVNLYAVLCFISLHQYIKEGEKNLPVIRERVPYQTRNNEFHGKPPLVYCTHPIE